MQQRIAALFQASLIAKLQDCTILAMTSDILANITAPFREVFEAKNNAESIFSNDVWGRARRVWLVEVHVIFVDSRVSCDIFPRPSLLPPALSRA